MSFSHLMQMGRIIVAGSSLLKDVPLSDSTCGELVHPMTKRCHITQVKASAASLSCSCSIDNVQSTLPVGTIIVTHSTSLDDNKSLLLGVDLMAEDLDDESLEFSYSDLEDKSEDESDSDFYFSSIVSSSFLDNE